MCVVRLALGGAGDVVELYERAASSQEHRADGGCAHLPGELGAAEGELQAVAEVVIHLVVLVWTQTGVPVFVAYLPHRGPPVGAILLLLGCLVKPTKFLWITA